MTKGRLALAGLTSLLAGCPDGTSLDGDAIDAPDGDVSADHAEADRPPREDAGGGEALPELLIFPPACGDGTIDPGEECDDRNRENGDECDWLCRLGPGTSDYPPPDESVGPLELSGEPVTVVPESEEAEGRWAVAWGTSHYGLAYQVVRPTPAVRFRVLDRNGTTVAGPVDLADAPGAAVSALVELPGGFGLLRSGPRVGYLTTLDSSGSPVGATSEIRRMPYEVSSSLVTGAATSTDRLYVRWTAISDDGSGVLLFDALGLDGGSLGLSAAIDAGVDPSSAVSTVPVPLADGFAAVVGFRVAVFDATLALAGWSGILPALPERGGPDALVRTADGLLGMWLHVPTEGGYDLWAAGFDELGELMVAPHVVEASLAGVVCYEGIAADAVPEGAVVAYVESRTDLCDSYELRVLNTDRWGWVRSPSVSVPIDGIPTPSSSFVVTADDVGWSLWVMTRDPVERRPRLQFQRVLPSS